jgi:hypothetical protein
MPRPPKADPRDRFVSFRCTEAEVTRLHSRAHAAGMSVSDYARHVLLGGNGAAVSASPPSIIANPDARALADQVRRVGVNVNQIAHRLNEHRMILPPNLSDLLEEIRAYVRQARNL